MINRPGSVITDVIPLNQKSMPSNPYSTPQIATRDKLTPRAVSLAFFLVAAFMSAWITFFIAYFVNGFGYGYLNTASVAGLFIPVILESLVVSGIVSGLAAAPLVIDTKITIENYCILALICALEFAMAYWFFVAFFEI